MYAGRRNSAGFIQKGDVIVTTMDAAAARRARHPLR